MTVKDEKTIKIMQKMSKLQLDIVDLEEKIKECYSVVNYLSSSRDEKSRKYGKLHDKLISIKQADNIVTKGEIDAVN
jgi:uncharacterized protein (DUF2344 family)